ncbi:DUF4148 domain-containing protein [Paraburkholderia sp. Ac-20340]|uniref:DUF4148 domain-containing protein n=1 Tax=Paraburkholderia sp. Ac-20340 TaxID=2703888 RepID=UPI00197EF8B4|nr:DUF4148 domain-containing protein [Paraburkholderia sp. Ac-20340]MBN3857930.1 DUF4148 domain-containing protein [Paraburkholderia sp. Ac-20340]
MRFSIRKPICVLTLAASLCGAAAGASAQDGASTPADAEIASNATPPTKAEQRKQARAQRKAARKAARAKNVAELNKLKGAGYIAGGGRDLDYPQNIQKAQQKELKEQKAASGAASQ